MLSIALAVCVALISATSAEEMPYKAVAVLTTGTGVVKGNVTFVEDGDEVVITGDLEGLNPGREHGFHVHEKGDLSQGCASAAGHYNPFNKQHGGQDAENRHVGDLGNIQANDRGVSKFTKKDRQVKLRGPYSVVGRSVVVHSDVDDLGLGGFADSLTTGHAGSRLACGVIGIS